MPFGQINIPPGVNSQLTETANPQGWSQSNLIRFYWGKAQKYGGWTQATPQTLTGTCRGMHGWADLNGTPYLALGTEQRLQVYDQGNLIDITPLRATSNVTPNFSTVQASNIVTVQDNTNGSIVNPGDWINIVTAVSVDGIILQGFYQVLGIPGANQYNISAGSQFGINGVSNGGAVSGFTTTNGSSTVLVALDNHGFQLDSLYTVHVSSSGGGVTLLGTYQVTQVIDIDFFNITASTSATSSVHFSENNGNVQIQYLIASGVAVNTPLTGYGIGPYGAGPYGQSSSAFTIEFLRQWYLDNWGSFLIGNPSGGSIYVWQPQNGATPAQVVSTAPTQNIASFVIAQARILVALGANGAPLTVGWSDAGDYTDFTPTATNQAGSFIFPTGSKIVAGLAVGLGALIWTDTDLWSMTYQGLPFVFSFQKIASLAECLAGHSVGVLGPIAMWPSFKVFYQFNGGAVQPVECPVWDFFFNNADFTQTEQIFAAPNSYYNEISWFFPFNDGSGRIGYIKYNLLENVWDYGLLPRTAWIDHSPLGPPMATDTSGLIQSHETGYDANGQPMPASIQTGYFVIGDGENFGFIDWVLPDVEPVNSPTLQLTVYATNFPNQPPIVYGPYTWNATTNVIPVGIRARQVSFQFSSQDTGTSWRLGLIRYRWSPAGRA